MNDMRKLIDIAEDLRGDPAMGRVESDEDEIKEAFLAGYQDGYTEGYNEASNRGSNETPEGSYEYWMKYDRK